MNDTNLDNGVFWNLFKNENDNHLVTLFIKSC